MGIGSEAKMNGTTGAGGGGFRSTMEHYLYSGEKKHVFGGIAIISVIFAIPWYYINPGTKHQSHQDYLENADKARSDQRLSSSAK